MAGAGDDLHKAFNSFATKGTEKAKEATSKDVTKWFTDAGCIDKKNITSNSLDIAFTKAKPKGKNTLACCAIKGMCEDLCKKDEAKVAKMMEKLAAAEPKGHGTTKTSKTGGVEKMTDSSQYTGSHQARFGADGKGKGIEGRKDIADDSGYVGAYKDKDTFDKKH